MNRTGNQSDLPEPSEQFAFGDVWLRFDRIHPGDAERGFVPYYHFRILVAGKTVDVGHINFRVGDTDHVLMSAGHIGYEIAPAHRGHGHAFQACRALGPWVRSFYGAVIITCDPENVPSIRTIERLQADFLGEVLVPQHDPHFQRGSRSKRRYRWKPN